MKRKNYKKENEELERKVKELEAQRDSLLKVIASLQNKEPPFPIWVAPPVINIPQIQTPSLPWQPEIWCGSSIGVIDAKMMSVN